MFIKKQLFQWFCLKRYVHQMHGISMQSNNNSHCGQMRQKSRTTIGIYMVFMNFLRKLQNIVPDSKIIVKVNVSVVLGYNICFSSVCMYDMQYFNKNNNNYYYTLPLKKNYCLKKKTDIGRLTENESFQNHTYTNCHIILKFPHTDNKPSVLLYIYNKVSCL